MSAWLGKFLESEIEVHYLTDNNMFSDKGRLVDFGDQWLELVKNYGKKGAETLLVPISAVRIVKVVGEPKTEAHNLLRPAGLGVAVPSEIAEVPQIAAD